MANQEYLGFNSFKKYECLRPWEREWIENEKEKQPYEPLQLPVDDYQPLQEPQHDNEDKPKRGVVIIEL
jgi:hypothetical protein